MIQDEQIADCARLLPEIDPQTMDREYCLELCEQKLNKTDWTAIIEEDRMADMLNPQLDLTFHTSMYFVGVTLLTVGYGDIAPVSAEAQLIVVVFLLLTLVLVPRSTSELLRLMEM